MSEPISSSGPRNASIVVIGEAPGADEVREGLPFVGYSGKLLRECLGAAGIDPESVFFTNLCRYRPPANELRAFHDRKGVPNDKIIQGLTLLKADLDAIKPNLVIALGNYPLHYLTGRGNWKPDSGYTGISNYRGYVLDGRAIAAGLKVLPTYHPAAATRDYSLKHLIQFDLGRAASQSKFPEIRGPRRCLVVEPEGAELEAWIKWLLGPTGSAPDAICHDRIIQAGVDPNEVQSDGYISADIEYIGSKLLCVGFTRSAKLAVILPTRTIADVDLVRGILLSGIPLCFQNAMFDCSILEWFYDIPCLKYLLHDTMIAMHAAYTEFPKDLGFIGALQTEWANMPPWWEGIDGDFWKMVKKLRDAGATGEAWHEVEKAYLPYNGGDVCATHEAMQALLSDELTNPAIRNTYLHEMSLIRPLWRIGKRGVRINLSAMQQLAVSLQEEAELLAAGVAHIAGGSVNVKAPQQVAKFLYDTLNLPKGARTKPTSRFPDGQWKMDDTTLAELSLKATNDRQRVAIRLIRDARERLDLVSKFCEIELDDDSRMRCHYDPAKTTTGRLSSRSFYPTGRGANLQNVPKDTRARAVFVPDPGYVFAYADLKSAESFVVAHITGDPEMLRLHTPEYLAGKLDGHKYVASFLLDKPIELITKDERYLGKRCRHAGNYSMGWFKLMQLVNADAQKTGVSINAARAKQLISKYRMLHPYLEGWWRSIEAELWQTHTLHTLHGRPRVFYGRPSEILPEAIAYNPQGTVGQTLNMGLLRLDSDYAESEVRTLGVAGNTPYEAFEEKSSLWMKSWDYQHIGVHEMYNNVLKSQTVQSLGFQMLLQVHDAIGFQVPEEHAATVLPLVRDLMAIPIEVHRRGLEPYTITIPVDIQTGYNWGEHEEKKNPNGLRPWHG